MTATIATTRISGNRTRSGGKKASPTAPIPSTKSRSSRSRAECLAGARRVLDIGAGEGQIARLARARRRGIRRRRRPDARADRGRAKQRGGGPVYLARYGRSAVVPRRRRSTPSIACLVFEHITGYEAAIAEVARVLRAGRSLRLPAEPPVAASAEQRLGDRRRSSTSSTGGSGRTSSPDLTMEELAPGVVLPFVHRPLSHYVNAMAAQRPADRTDGGAGAARRLPRQGAGVPRRRARSRACSSWSPARLC